MVTLMSATFTVPPLFIEITFWRPFFSSQPANSGPGEIYPSIVDVPQPGCWRFDLSWSGHRATVYLEYQ